MQYVKKLKIISENLRKSKKVNSYDTSEEREADTIAHALLDMEESYEVLFKQLLPKLSDPAISEKDIDEALLDIGEELRHILYHIKDSKFYGYLE